ncbi:MAG: hypothetical protein K0R90_1310 [Oscillospiraceae bacterium]|nr:hypothetical protein [Oscillospiraceae bacterium]
MELNLNHENICINEVIFDGSVEQSVELDYLLPDYCPSIFKVLKCKVVPKINSYRIAGDKLTIDATAFIKILYVCEETSLIRSLEQKMPFSKTVDLKAPSDDALVTLEAKSDYVNCRVVNPKRLDIRGAVSIRIKVMDQKCTEVVSDVEGMGVQVKKSMVNTGNAAKNATKQFSVYEDLELSYGKPPMVNCLYANATAVVTDFKIIANKVIAKGEIALHILYSTDENEQKPEVMEHSIPISQILDMAGIDEDYQCVINFDVSNVEIDPKNNDEENKVFGAQFMVNASCKAYKNKDIQVISDLYSTAFESEVENKTMKFEKVLSPINEQSIAKSTIDIPEDSINYIYDILCEANDVASKISGNEITFSGKLNASVIALNNENLPIVIEQVLPFEHKAPIKNESNNVYAEIFADVVSVAYSLAGVDKIEIRAEIKIGGSIHDVLPQNIVTEVKIDEENAKKRDDLSALTIYFADKGERVWDIAKKYNTSVQAIMDENNLDNDEVVDRGMILIPIVD